MASKTFIKITNKDIYDKIIGIDHKLDNVSKLTSWHSKAIGIIFAILLVLITAIAAGR